MAFCDIKQWSTYLSCYLIDGKGEKVEIADNVKMLEVPAKVPYYLSLHYITATRLSSSSYHRQQNLQLKHAAGIFNPANYYQVSIYSMSVRCI
jgi:hypothetical protein